MTLENLLLTAGLGFLTWMGRTLVEIKTNVAAIKQRVDDLPCQKDSLECPDKPVQLLVTET